MHTIWATLFRMTFLLSPLTGFSAWIKILHHLWVRVMSDRSTSMFHIMSLRVLLAAMWLNGALPLFVRWACRAESVMCCWYILALVQLFLRINWNTIFPLSSWSVAARCTSTDRTAPSFTFNLFTLSLTCILACWEWLWRIAISNLITVLIRNSQIWLLNGRAVLSWVSMLMPCILALSQLLLVVPSLSREVLWIRCRNHISMYTWWTHIRVAWLRLVLIGWMNNLRLLRTYQHVLCVSLVLCCSWCFCLWDTIPRIWFRAVTTSTDNLSRLCVLLGSRRVISAVNLYIAGSSTLLSILCCWAVALSSLIHWSIYLLLNVLNVGLHRLSAVEDWLVDSSSHWIDRDLDFSIWRAFECSVQNLLLELCLVANHREISCLSWFLITIRTDRFTHILFLGLWYYILFRRSCAVL